MSIAYSPIANLSHAAEPPAVAPRVLLVEDEPMLLRSLTRLLRASGALVTQAANGLIALQLMKVRRFDVLLTDLNMPDMGGLELAVRIREVDAGLAVVVMTGSPCVETAIRAVELGVLRYLLKPVLPEQLLGSVLDAARTSRERREAPVVNVSFATPQLDPLEERFDAGLAALWMAYQPIYKVDGTLCGYEALVRSDEASMATPIRLLEAGEQLRRVHDLGRAIRAAVAKLLYRTSEVVLFVNLHPLDLIDERLFSDDDPLSKHASRVIIEITERAALDEVPNSESRIRALRDLGFRVAVDDLGAGYAGLASLAQLSPEVVKIDMSLIRNIDSDVVKQKLVRMVASVSHELGATVVGEGIETEAERLMAIELGCDLLQGYLLGRPSRTPDIAGA